MNCPICHNPLTEYHDQEYYLTGEQFIRRCNDCALQWQKLPVKNIIEEFSKDYIHRYTKLTVLNMVNALPYNDLFEFYLVGRDPLTIQEFTNAIGKYEAYKTNQEIKKTANEKRAILNQIRR